MAFLLAVQNVVVLFHCVLGSWSWSWKSSQSLQRLLLCNGRIWVSYALTICRTMSKQSMVYGKLILYVAKLLYIRVTYYTGRYLVGVYLLGSHLGLGK